MEVSAKLEENHDIKKSWILCGNYWARFGRDRDGLDLRALGLPPKEKFAKGKPAKGNPSSVESTMGKSVNAKSKPYKEKPAKANTEKKTMTKSARNNTRSSAGLERSADVELPKDARTKRRKVRDDDDLDE